MTTLALLLCCTLPAPLPEPVTVQHYRAGVARAGNLVIRVPGYVAIMPERQQPGDYIKRVTVYYGGREETVYYWVITIAYWETAGGRVRVVYAVFLTEELFEARAWAGR